MDVRVFENVVRYSIEVRLGFDIGKGYLRGLLHDITELSGQTQLALPGHTGRLDEENLTAVLGPGEPVDTPGISVRSRTSG